MPETVIPTLAAALLAFLVSSSAIPFVTRLAVAMRALDYPGERRDQENAVPRLGGLAVMLGLIIGIGCVAVPLWATRGTEMKTIEAAAMLLALLLVFVCGLLEDTIGLSSFKRVVFEIAAAILVIQAGWSFKVLNLPFFGDVQLGVLSGLVSLVWIVGVTNAVNLLDGLDGLAGGVAAIIAASMLAYALWHEDLLAVLILAGVLGACLGFLRHNWAPAKIYLGDSGSLTLGFLLAIVSIRSSMKGPAAIAILVPILALGLPVIDTLLVMLFRFTRRSRGPVTRRIGRIFRADRNHIHHLMCHLVSGRKKIVVTIYSMALLFCSLAFFVAISKNAALGFFLVGVEIVVILAIRQLGLHADVIRMALEKRKAAREDLMSRVSGKNLVPGLQVPGSQVPGSRFQVPRTCEPGTVLSVRYGHSRTDTTCR